MRGDVRDRLVQAARREDLDALVLCSPENFAYASGFVVPSQPLLRHRHATAVVTADGRMAFLGVDMEASTIRDRAPEVPLTVWAEFADDAMAALGSLLAELGLVRARIGLETGYLSKADFDRLQRRLPDAVFSSDDRLLARLRQIKTPEEIALLRRLSRIADRAITEAFGNVGCGDTEMDIAGHLTRLVYELGAQEFRLLIVATGERSQLPNVGPSGRRLEEGDVCRVEIFPMIDGYHAGVCRTAVVGAPPPHADDIWAVLTDCKRLLLDRIRPGASCREIYREFIARLVAKDLPPISFAGHGIGLLLHEEPYIGDTPVIGSKDDAQLEAGMVLGVEPLCYRTGYGYGMQNKDMILVTETGCELLSDHADTDRLLKVGRSAEA